MYEYVQMAQYYDLFYTRKNYDQETAFLTKLIGKRKKILDVGCGTGIHMANLEKNNYEVTGLDLSPAMLQIAQKRTHGPLMVGNLLNYEFSEKYDVIISMFAVFNHLPSKEQFWAGINHLLKYLNDDGILIIDLHNGRSNGEKSDTTNNIKRVMKWQFDSVTFREHTDIYYYKDEKVFHDTHDFLIYSIAELKRILESKNLKYKIYENYTFKVATDDSKNLILVIAK